VAGSGTGFDEPVTATKPVLPAPGPVVFALYRSTTKYAGPSPAGPAKGLINSFTSCSPVPLTVKETVFNPSPACGPDVAAASPEYPKPSKCRSFDESLIKPE
jgi:hypothetical protein